MKKIFPGSRKEGVKMISEIKNKELREINYDRDSSKGHLIRTFNKIDKLMPKLNFKERAFAVELLDEIGSFIELKERDEDLEARGIY